MYFSNAILLALSVVGLSSAAPLTKRACSNLELVFARGTSDPGIVGPPLYNQLRRLVPGATYKNVDYPASFSFLTSAAQGTASMQQHIEARHRECPQMKFALSGYSQGVMVIHGLKLSKSAQDQVVAIVSYGDPYKLLGPMATWPINDKSGVLDNCASGDPICGGGFNIAAHLGYGMDAAPGARHIAARAGGGSGTSAAGGLGGLLGGAAAPATPSAAPAAGGLGGLLGGLGGAAPAAPSPAAGGLGGLLGGLTGGAAAPASGGLGGLLGGLGGAAPAAPAAPAASPAAPAAPAASPAAGGLGGLLGGLGGAAPAAPAAPAASPAAGGLGGLLGGLGGGAAAPAGGLLGGLLGQ